VGQETSQLWLQIGREGGEVTVAKTNEELERLAQVSAELDLRDGEDLNRFFELVRSLTKDEVLRLAEIHERRAYGEME
jgi:hypothetical protein